MLSTEWGNPIRRGGQTLPIWIVDPATSRVSDKIPRDNSNDSNPIWVDNSIYFLSDRNGPVTLFRYDLDTKNVTEVIKNNGFDFKSATAGPGGIVIEKFGALHLYDFEKGTARQLNIHLTGDMPEVRPHYVKVGKRIVAANISPTGARAVFEARGEILTVPAEKGDIRNLTNTLGVIERDPSWSPDGKWIACFSDVKVGPSPDGKDSREVTVVPVASEFGLRRLAWIEDNRRQVDALSNGRLAYVYLPDTFLGGYTNFNRYYFAQVGKEGAVIDERFNGGGLIADYIIDYLKRPLQGYFAARDGDDYITPVGAIYGPKVMIINEYAGSGGDMMPWLFRDAKIGPLVGKRTWGGLVGMAGAAALMDGGFTGAPQSGFWNPNGTWDVENHGVEPDLEVEMDPAVWRAGHDPQLEKAVRVGLELLEKNPLPKHKKPAYPNYHRKD
jgi:hypothetical protein